MSVKIYRVLFVVSIIILAGCYPKGAEYIEELDLVYTNYYNQYDFQAKHTYALPDSVIKITGENFEDPDGNHRPEFLPKASGDVILNQIKTNMTAYGWTKVDRSAHPDVLLLVSSMTTTNIFYYYDWWYWDWWYGGYYPPWGWYYPCCYYPGYMTGYRSGSVLMQMVDPNTATAEGNVPVVWTGILNGLAEGGQSSIATRVQAGIDQAYAQSPYLKH